MHFTRAIAMAATLVLGGSATAFAQDQVPAGYPAEYSQIIEAAKAEPDLIFYSSIASDQVQPLLDAFKAKYPWTNVQYLEQSAYGVIERYLNEVGTGTPTASLLFTAAPDAWLKLVARGDVVDYLSPEAASLPPSESPSPGLYAAGGDPLIFIWNKLLLPPELVPTGLADLVAKVAANPDVFNNKITTYGADQTGFGYSVHFALAKKHGDQIWDWYRTLGPVSKFERSVGTMIERVQSGEYVLGYGVAAQTPWTMIQDPAIAEIMGVGYFDDGNPLGVRGAAVMKAGASQNQAKLFLDFLLSREGQIAYATKGKLPARLDVTREDIGGGHTLASFLDLIGGPENALIIGYDPDMLTGYDDFIAKWKEANGVQ